MIVTRLHEQQVKSKLISNKVVVLLGARRVGKTELLKKIMNDSKNSYLFLTGDDIVTHQVLEQRSLENYKRLLGNIRFLIIDEAQEIKDIGMKLKLMIDNIDGLKVLVSGSSAFELNNQIGEPLVGRMYTFHLYPLAQIELSAQENYLQTIERLEERLIFGASSTPNIIALNEPVAGKYIRHDFLGS